MSVILGIFLTLGVFFLVVLVHEFGHFFVARWTGMKVLEFGFGIPPRMKRLFTDKKWTDFTLNWLPIGGFVRILGEDPRSSDAFQKWAFLTKNLFQRVAVLIAGVVMNFVLAWVIFSTIFFLGTKPLSFLPIDIGNTHSYFMPSFSEAVDRDIILYDGIALSPLTGSIAEKSWILPWDTVLSLNGKPVLKLEDVTDALVIGWASDMVVRHSNSREEHIVVTPENGKIGVMVSYKNLTLNQDIPVERFWLSDSLIMGAKETYFTSVLTLKVLGKTFQGLFFSKNVSERENAKEMLSGPIGVGNAFVSMVEMHVPVMIIFIFVALLSVNLGVLNILPFPALDGGRIVTTVFYAFFSLFKKWRERFLIFEGIFHSVGFFILLVLMLYVAGLDVMRFF